MLTLERATINSQQSALDHEWLVTNGIGGYASGTVAGVLTRRYHGLLVAAIEPPAKRNLLVAKFDDTVQYDGKSYTLFANSWSPNTVFKNGFIYLDSFRLEGTTPVWSYALGDALLEKRIWMAQGENTTYIRYDLLRGRVPLTLSVKAMVNYRSYHSTTRGGFQMDVSAVERGVKVIANADAVPFYILSDRATSKPQHSWYRNYYHAIEVYRGYVEREDNLFAADFSATLEPNESVCFVCTTEENIELDSSRSYASQKEHEAQLLLNVNEKWSFDPVIPAKKSADFIKRESYVANYAMNDTLPEVLNRIRHLVLSADQFIVARTTNENPDGRTVIAGYPWFGDWGRDTMIALPGLTLTTNRPTIARNILKTFAQFVDRGMLPNRFPDENGETEYNTVDATLWYFEAIRAYHAATGDDSLIVELFPILQEIIEQHQNGTRYNIRKSHDDGLLHAGEDGVQLTWMDAKVDGWVVTPRIGKPVEINALWYNALRSMADFAQLIGEPSDVYAKEAGCVKTGFSKFWYQAGGYLYDVVNGARGGDTKIRPNQLFAVSLHHSPLSAEQQRSVVEICAQHLYTPHGLRSLSPSDPEYVGEYGGDRHKRDAAYHQGTVWGWLIGPFIAAHMRVYNDPVAARSFLLPLLRHLKDACVGQISECFDGNAPFTSRACFAQAWSVAEVLRVWELTDP